MAKEAGRDARSGGDGESRRCPAAAEKPSGSASGGDRPGGREAAGRTRVFRVGEIRNRASGEASRGGTAFRRSRAGEPPRPGGGGQSAASQSSGSNVGEIRI